MKHIQSLLYILLAPPLVFLGCGLGWMFQCVAIGFMAGREIMQNWKAE